MFMFEFFVILLMLGLNAVFAAYEMGLASISRARVAALADNKKKGALQAVYMKERMEGSLATIQIGITLVGVIAAATGGAGVKESFAPYLQSHLRITEPLSEFIALVLFIIPLSLSTIVFAELIPKIVALNNKEWIVLLLSPPMKMLSTFLYPVILVMEKVVKKAVFIGTKKITPAQQTGKVESFHELKAAASIARASRLMSEHGEKIVLSAAQLSLRTAHNVMIQATDISMIYSGSTVSDALIKATRDMHTRFPVCDKVNDPQSISGFVNFKDILSVLRTSSHEPIVKSITRPIKKVNGNMPLSQLLEEMIQEKIHINLVVKDSQVLGIMTLEDILEELVGDIEDEFDIIPNYIHPYGTAWIMGGGVPMTTVALTVGFDWSKQFIPESVPKLAIWCAQKLGQSLKGGDIIESEGLRVIPHKFRRNKMIEALVSVIKDTV